MTWPTRRPCACKGTRSASIPLPTAGPSSAPATSAKNLIYLHFQPLTASAPILDSPRPSQYGPRGLGAVEPCDLVRTVAGVESMADDARKDDREQPPRDEAALSARFQRLGERLGHVHPGRPPENSPGQRPTTDPSALARGLRLSTELVAGVLAGAGIGWVLDRWLGISPWGMIVFLLLGFAAGVLNVMRVAGVVPANTLDPPGSKR
jgi:ATP synthase protein I